MTYQVFCVIFGCHCSGSAGIGTSLLLSVKTLDKHKLINNRSTFDSLRI